MNHRTLGCTSLTVSELCLATNHFTHPADEAVHLALLDAFHEQGGNFIHAGSDAGMHAPPGPSALPDALVGRWWRWRGIPRDELVLAANATIAPASATQLRAPGEAVRLAVDHRLRQLGTDRLDVLTVRWTGPGAAPEALRRALDWLVREGLVRYVAFSDLAPWRVAAALREGFDRMHCRINAVEAEYSLLHRCAFESELEDLCREQRLGFIARGALGTWGLPGAERAARPRRRDWTGRAFGCNAQRHAAQAVADIARDRGCSFSQVTLAWVLHHPTVTSAIVEARSATHLRDLAAAADLVLDRDELKQLHRATALQRVVVPARNEATATLPERRVSPTETFVELETR